MSLSDLLSITFSLSGLGLILVAVFSTIANVVSVTRARNWETRRPKDTFVGYAWQELGRALVLGFVVALGCTPVGVFVFAGMESFWSSLLLLSGIWWTSSALIFFYAFIFAGFGGYLNFHNKTQSGVSKTALWFELVIVLGASLPFFYVFIRYLIPALWPILTLLARTWQQYVAIYFS